MPLLQSTMEKMLTSVMEHMCMSTEKDLLSSLAKKTSHEALLAFADSLVCSVASKSRLSWNVKGFLDIAYGAMCELEAHDKPNVVWHMVTNLIHPTRRPTRWLTPTHWSADRWSTVSRLLTDELAAVF